MYALLSGDQRDEDDRSSFRLSGCEYSAFLKTSFSPSYLFGYLYNEFVSRIIHVSDAPMQQENRVPTYAYEECLESLASGHTVIQCPSAQDAIVHIHSIAPDLLKARPPFDCVYLHMCRSVPVIGCAYRKQEESIPPEEVVKGPILGAGAFGTVYKVQLHPSAPSPPFLLPEGRRHCSRASGKAKSTSPSKRLTPGTSLTTPKLTR